MPSADWRNAPPARRTTAFSSGVQLLLRQGVLLRAQREVVRVHAAFQEAHPPAFHRFEEDDRRALLRLAERLANLAEVMSVDHRHADVETAKFVPQPRHRSD